MIGLATPRPNSRVPHPPLEERGEDAERGRCRQQVQHRRHRRDEQAPEGDQQQQEAQTHDGDQEQGQLGVRHRREVVHRGRQAAYIDLQRGAVRVLRQDRVAQVADQGGGGRGLGRGRRQDLGHLDRRPGARRGLRGRGLHGGDPGHGGERVVELVERGAVGRGLDLGDQEQRTVEARPEPSRKHFIGLIGVA